MWRLIGKTSILLSLLAYTAHGFAVSVGRRSIANVATPIRLQHLTLRSDPVDQNFPAKDLDSVVAPSINDNDKNEPAYPIDLPSPLLLAGSVLLAIVSTGTLFDISANAGNNFDPKVIIPVAGLPLALFLFYASIQKGIAETEADDALFLGRK